MKFVLLGKIYISVVSVQIANYLDLPWAKEIVFMDSIIQTTSLTVQEDSLKKLIQSKYLAFGKEPCRYPCNSMLIRANLIISNK